MQNDPKYKPTDIIATLDKDKDFKYEVFLVSGIIQDMDGECYYKLQACDFYGSEIPTIDKVKVIPVDTVDNKMYSYLYSTNGYFEKGCILFRKTDAQPIKIMDYDPEMKCYQTDNGGWISENIIDNEYVVDYHYIDLFKLIETKLKNLTNNEIH